MVHSLFTRHTGAVILAAGKGTRMHSDTPKVLQRILEEPMLRYVYDAVEPVCPGWVKTVVGHGEDRMRAAFPFRVDGFVRQGEQLGTGHALQTVWPEVLGAGLELLLVVNGDTPLLRQEDLRDLLSASTAEKAAVAFLTLTLNEAGSFGRVLRRNGRVAAIVEAKDYTEAEHGGLCPADGHEINAGIYCLDVQAVTELLPLLARNNNSGEYYITDLVGLAVERNLKVVGHNRNDNPDLLGVNTPAELVRAEDRMRERIVNFRLEEGVIVRAAQSVRIGPDVDIARGCEITGPCEIYGKTRVDAGARIESHCRIQDADIAENAIIRSFCHVQDAVIGKACIVGPYARLRPGAVLEQDAHVGNFVEMKKARLGRGAKANHLTYLGDAEVGAESNIGAGTITCNYDGTRKHVTVVGESAFIGSNTALVAPVTVGRNALVGAGSVITKNVPDGHLGLTRAPQKNIARKGGSEKN